MTIMKTLFCGIFIFFFLEIRSETTTRENNPSVVEQPNTTQLNHGVRSELTVKTPADVTLPHNAPSSTVFDSKIVTTSSSADQTTADKTRIASEKPFAHSVSGTEKPTHRETSSITTTAVNITSASTTEVKSPEEKSTVSPTSEQKQFSLLPKNTTFTTPTTTAELTTGFLPILNKSTNITTIATTTVRNLASVSPKTEPQFSENMTGFPATQKTSALTTSLTTTTNKSAIINTTMSKETLSTMSTVNMSTENISASTTSATTTRHNQTIQNITSKVINQSSSTTEVPRTNATNGTTLVNRIKTTQIARNISATTEPLPKHQSSITATNIPTTVFSNISTTNVTTNATHGVWIPAFTKTLPTIKPHSTEESTQKTQPCSTVGVVKQCLIVIASLAVVATIFIISTIILCTKLSSRKYKLRRQQQGTEMKCISSLLNERSTSHHRYTRQRSPVPNGVLVIHPCGDSDDEIGDNFTLSSFLPDNDRYV